MGAIRLAKKFKSL